MTAVSVVAARVNGGVNVRLDFHGFTQIVQVDAVSDRITVSFMAPLQMTDTYDDIPKIRNLTFEPVGGRWVCAGCWLCSFASRRHDLIEPALRGERMRVRKLRRRKEVTHMAKKKGRPPKKPPKPEEYQAP